MECTWFVAFYLRKGVVFSPWRYKTPTWSFAIIWRPWATPQTGFEVIYCAAWPVGFRGQYPEERIRRSFWTEPMRTRGELPSNIGRSGRELSRGSRGVLARLAANCQRTISSDCRSSPIIPGFAKHSLSKTIVTKPRSRRTIGGSQRD